MPACRKEVFVYVYRLLWLSFSGTFATFALLVLNVGCARFSGQHAQAPVTAPVQNLLVVMDGLRPDHVTPELMPNLSAFSATGVFFERHHAVYPTATRVNAASIATGSYPRRHGLMGNSVYFPHISDRALSTASHENLLRIEETTGGRLLLTPSLGEVLDLHSRRYLVTSSGSPGSAFLLNHKMRSLGIVNTTAVLPESQRDRVYAALGQSPEDATPNVGRNTWAVDAYLEFGLQRETADVAVVWISDPDRTGHDYGIGHPVTLDAVRYADELFGRILGAHSAAGLDDKINILVASDHGFATHRFAGNVNELVAEFLDQEGLTSDDVFRIDAGFYVKNRDERIIRDLVRLFQRTEWLGPIFTRQGNDTEAHEGFVPGTLSTALVGLDNERGPDVYLSYNWSDEPSDFGWPGSTGMLGIAGHGGASKWEIHATLIAGGPAFRSGLRSPFPSGSVDLAPTLLYLTGIQAPIQMEGRVLKEALVGHPRPDLADMEMEEVAVAVDLGPFTYEIVFQRSCFNDATYFGHAKAQRHERRPY